MSAVLFAHLFSRYGASNGRVFRTVYIQDLVLEMSIGAFVCEKNSKQPIVVSMAVQVSEPERPIDDSLVNVLDYALLRDSVLRFAGDGHTHLQETLCQKLSDFALGLPGVEAAYVRIGKLAAYSDCAAVGCELLRFRS